MEVHGEVVVPHMQISLQAVKRFPTGTIAIRYDIRNRRAGSTFGSSRIIRVALSSRINEIQYVITGLSRSTKYVVDVRLETRYRECFSYFTGNYSDPIIVRTTSTG